MHMKFIKILYLPFWLEGFDENTVNPKLESTEFVEGVKTTDAIPRIL